MADYELIYNCPGCGKPSKTPEGALTNQCEYCNLVVRLGAPGRVLKYFYPSRIDEYGARMAADRYLKQNGLPLTSNIAKAKMYYLPFYRFRGIALDYIKPSEKISALGIDPAMQVPTAKVEPKLKVKDFDVTIPGTSSADFGLVSLGIRPQTVPLYGFSREEIPSETVVVKSDITPTVAEEQALQMRDSNTLLYNKKEADISAMIGERISAIYFPIWALWYEVKNEKKTVFVDALAKRGYYQIEGFYEYSGDVCSGKNSHFIKPLRHQCPNCGDDLTEDHFSLFYPCKNCGRYFTLDNSGGYEQTGISSADAEVVAPFWRFPLAIEGKRNFKTVAEFSRLLGSEIALLRKEKKNNQFYLYSPAFKSSDVRSWFKKAYTMLVTQPHDHLNDKLGEKYVPLNIDIDEARQMAIFLWKKLTLKYAWGLPELLNLQESSLQNGEIVWLPAKNYALIRKSVGFKEVNVVK